MGQQLSRLSESISAALLSSLDASPAYRRRLMQLLQTYTADHSLSDAQVLQWSAEKLVADATNQSHELGARFLPALAAIDLHSFDATTVTQCIAQAAMQYLEELKLDMNFHIRFFDCAKKGSVEKLRQIEQFVEINYQNESGSTALMIACHHNHVDLCRYLLSLHASINLQDSLGWTALMFSCREGHAELVDLLLEDEWDTDIDLTTSQGINALMCAADAGHTRIVRALMDKSADVNACTNAGDTALLQACHGGHTAIVRMLLAAGAEVNVSGKHLCSPSLLAARFQSYEILELLILHGADIAAQDEQGRTICDFECEGQVAAAIQRGVVGRFNRTIRVARPLHGASNALRAPPQHHTSTLQDSPLSSAHSVASSVTPPGMQAHYTPHPRKFTEAHRTTTAMAPTSPTRTDGRASTRSYSRSPSPSGLPPIRVRKNRGTAPGGAAASSSASHAAASSSASVASPSAAAAIASSRAFQHPLLASAELTDDALAAMEASVEQILHRRDPNTGARSVTPSAPSASGMGAGSQAQRQMMPAQASFDQPRSILKSSRIDSPAHGSSHRSSGADSDHHQPFMMPLRSTSDNVHQEDLADDSESHDDEAEREETERRRRAEFAARALHQKQQVQQKHKQKQGAALPSSRPSSAPHSAAHSEGEVVSGEDDEEDEEDEEDEQSEHSASDNNDDDEQQDSEDEADADASALAPIPTVQRPPALTLKVSSGASPFKRALDEHLAAQTPASPFVLTATPPAGQSDRGVSQSPTWSASPSAEPTASPEAAKEQSAEEIVVAWELARLQAGLPMDASQIAQVAAQLSATAAIVGISVAPARGGLAEEAAASPLATDLNSEEQHDALQGAQVLEVRQPRRRESASDASASSVTTPVAPPKHVAALREAMAAAKEERTSTASSPVANDDEQVAPRSPVPSSASASAAAAPSAPSSAEGRSDKSTKRKPARRRKAFVDIAPPPPPQPLQSPFAGASPSVSPAAASASAAATTPARTPPFIPQLNPFQLTSSASASSSAKPSPTLRSSKAPSPSPSARVAVAMPVQQPAASAPTSASTAAVPTPVAAAPTSVAAPSAPSQSASNGATASVSSATGSPLSSSSASVDDDASRSRQAAEREVDVWLAEHDFNSVARSSLHGFSFAELRSLEHSDCVELLGERDGPLLFLKLRDAPIPASLLRTPSPSPPPAVQPSQVPPPLLSNWLEAAVQGVAVAAAKEAEEKARSAHASEAEDTEEEEAEDDVQLSTATPDRRRGASSSPIASTPVATATSSSTITSPSSAPVASTPVASSAPTVAGAGASSRASPVSASSATFDSRARSSFGFISDALRTSFVFQGAGATERSSAAAAAPVATSAPPPRAMTSVTPQIAQPVMLPPRPSAQAIHAVQGAMTRAASPPASSHTASSATASSSSSSSSDPTAVASQWLSSFEKSFTSVADQLKHKLAGANKSALDEMRRMQPHRLRRQQQRHDNGVEESRAAGGARPAPSSQSSPPRSGYVRSWDLPPGERQTAAAQASLLGSQAQSNQSHKQAPTGRSKVPPSDDYMSAF